MAWFNSLVRKGTLAGPFSAALITKMLGNINEPLIALKNMAVPVFQEYDRSFDKLAETC